MSDRHHPDTGRCQHEYDDEGPCWVNLKLRWEVTKQQIMTIADAEEGPKFWRIPERWLEDLTWRCPNNHVSTTYLKSEARGALCLAGGCHQELHVTFPEDHDGPLVAP